MSIDRRVQQLERAAGAQFRAAVAAFAASWTARALDPRRQAYVRAQFQARGCDATRPEELDRWHAAQPPAYRATHAALRAAIFGMVLRPDEAAPLRAGLAAVAPHLGLSADAAPVALIHALAAALAAEDAAWQAS